MGDPSHDGNVFDVALSDVPENKADLVSGSCTLPAPSGPTTVAVKIVDMLGEEVLVTCEIPLRPTPRRWPCSSAYARARKQSATWSLTMPTLCMKA